MFEDVIPGDPLKPSLANVPEISAILPTRIAPFLSSHDLSLAAATCKAFHDSVRFVVRIDEYESSKTALEAGESYPNCKSLYLLTHAIKENSAWDGMILKQHLKELTVSHFPSLEEITLPLTRSWTFESLPMLPLLRVLSAPSVLAFDGENADLSSVTEEKFPNLRHLNIFQHNVEYISEEDYLEPEEIETAPGTPQSAGTPEDSPEPMEDFQIPQYVSQDMVENKLFDCVAHSQIPEIGAHYGTINWFMTSSDDLLMSLPPHPLIESLCLGNFNEEPGLVGLAHLNDKTLFPMLTEICCNVGGFAQNWQDVDIVPASPVLMSDAEEEDHAQFEFEVDQYLVDV